MADARDAEDAEEVEVDDGSAEQKRANAGLNKVTAEDHALEQNVDHAKAAQVL
jgi:hypothetical protein